MILLYYYLQDIFLFNLEFFNCINIGDNENSQFNVRNALTVECSD